MLHSINALAGDIEQGTLTLGASSSAAIYWRDYQDDYGGENTSSYGFSLEFGYFFMRNAEMGSAARFSYHEREDSNAVGFGFAPYLTYHIPLSLKSNLYTTLGASYSRNTFSDDEYVTIQSVFAEVGYEYFLSDRIAVALGIKGDRETVDFSDCEGCSYSRNLMATQLRFKLFF